MVCCAGINCHTSASNKVWLLSEGGHSTFVEYPRGLYLHCILRLLSEGNCYKYRGMAISQ